MKIIDLERKGNVIRFALGSDDLTPDDWGGDDWDDAPYEHNAGPELFATEKRVDVAFGYNVEILEACNDYHYRGNSPFCKDDFKERKAPMLIIDPTGDAIYYSQSLGNENLFKIYMGDTFEDIDWENLGAVILKGE